MKHLLTLSLLRENWWR